MSQQTHTSKVNIASPSKQSGIGPDRVERGERIKALRVKREMSQSDFAKKLGVTKQTQIAYESGARVPDAEYLAALYYEYAVDLGPLITGAPRARIGASTTGGVRSVSDTVSEMLYRYESLTAPLRKTVDDVLLLAHLANQSRRPSQAAEGYPKRDETPPLVLHDATHGAD